MNKLFCAIITVLCFCLTCGVALCNDAVTADLAGGADAGDIVTVTLRGKMNHFGKDYHDTVPGVSVWLAEFPGTRDLGIKSDDSGWWTFSVKKIRGVPVRASFVYEKEGWITTKTNVFTIGDEDNTDIAIQFIDPQLYREKMKPGVEMMLAGFLPGEKNLRLENALVVTVGKSWASMLDDRLPHGDPGAKCSKVPGAVGPIYFDEAVRPNPVYRATSVDGGVAWINAPEGVFTITAKKKGVDYPEVTFDVAPADKDIGVVLYISSPPDSLMGSNQSGPGSAEIITGESAGAAMDPLAVAREVIELQKQLLIEGDLQKLLPHFTPRLRDMITADAVAEAQHEAENYGIEELVESVQPGEYEGRETLKIKMANGRTLTTLVKEGEAWLADTVWFR